jgi:hypothetical protein
VQQCIALNCLVQRLRNREPVEMHRATPTFLRRITFGSDHSACLLAHELLRKYVNFHRRLTKFHRSAVVAVHFLQMTKAGVNSGNCNIFE